MIVKMLEDIRSDGGCSKGDIVVAKYLYDGKYQLLYKYDDADKTPIDFQCYDYQVEEAKEFLLEELELKLHQALDDKDNILYIIKELRKKIKKLNKGIK